MWQGWARARNLRTIGEQEQEIWAQDPTIDTEPNENDKRRRIQVTISRLRSKLKEVTGEDIVSIREHGYRFIPT